MCYARDVTRVADFPIDPIFLTRWSPRAMDGSALDAATLAPLFEAARWSPSSSNKQPWRFVYALRGTEEFHALYDLLAEGNRVWCAQAGALVAVCSVAADERGTPSPSHAFDAGAAWMAMALQGARMNLVVHAMGGFDRARAPGVLGLPHTCEVHCLVAVGRQGDPAQLPEPLRARETPSGRRPVVESVSRGRYGVPGLAEALEPVRHDLRVRADAAWAFEAFTRHMGRWWPLADHSVSAADAVDCEVEPRAGGRVVERQRDGTTHVWGTVWRWDPPWGFTVTWHPGRDAQPCTLLTVRFEDLRDEGPSLTRVSLRHEAWEAFEDGAARRTEYAREWPHVMALYRDWTERGR